MATYNVNYNKANFQTDIRRKQAMYNRFKRRYHASNDPTERRFLKCEATRLVTELRTWSRKWQNWGWGSYNWITKNYTVTNFTTTTGGRRVTTWKSPTNRSYNYHKNTPRCYTSRTTTRRPTSRTHTRTYAARKSYLAW
ncbi:MAG TPA: hypothetical protein VMV94_02555 [Phycisphaerae bacterium]|nr:hypothetical protein [Phycisphaerae bacterium]